jgi:antitoxin component YwqK of YwqJK toxin-antitoxin module
MKNGSIFFALMAGSVALLCPFSCTDNPVEKVEHRNEHGQMERFERRKKDFAKEGLYQRFAETGELLEEARYSNDTLDGERKYFYPNGKTESIEHYSKGVYQGKYEKYYDTGALQLEQEYVNGALEGLSIAYYPNGKMKEKVTLRNNEENGPFSEYYENGMLKAEGQYIPGEDLPLEQGELKEYDETGQLVRIAECQSGVCHTKWKKE